MGARAATLSGVVKRSLSAIRHAWNLEWGRPNGGGLLSLALPAGCGL